MSNAITRSATEADRIVGSRIKARRQQLGMSQERMGEAIGVTFQQVQKYEKGTNRISVSKLVAIAHALRCPVAFFFEGMDRGDPLPDPARTLSQHQVAVMNAMAGLPLSVQAGVAEMVRGAVRIARADSGLQDAAE